MNTEQSFPERAQAYAQRLRAQFDTGILTTMQEKPLWCLYMLEADEKGNMHKPPYHPKGYKISVAKPRHWSSLDNVLEALASGQFPFAGIGIMLPAPYVLIDKDAREDAPLYDREAHKIVSTLALRLLQQNPSYAELSPRNGLHIITEGRPKRGNFKTPELELYTNWFSTVTTRHLPGTPLEVTAQQQAIEMLENEFHPPVAETAFQNTGGGVRGSARLSALPAEAVNDPVLQELLRGDMSRYGNNHSSADWHLLMKLLHWTGDDISLVKSIFLNSPLGQRDKAQDETGRGRRGNTSYVDRTIERIIQKRRNPPMRR